MQALQTTHIPNIPMLNSSRSCNSPSCAVPPAGRVPAGALFLGKCACCLLRFCVIASVAVCWEVECMESCVLSGLLVLGAPFALLLRLGPETRRARKGDADLVAIAVKDNHGKISHIIIYAVRMIPSCEEL